MSFSLIMLVALGGFAVEYTGFSEVRHHGANTSDTFWICIAIFLAVFGGATNVAIELIRDSNSADLDSIKRENLTLRKNNEFLEKQVAALLSKESKVIRFIRFVCEVFLNVVSIKRASVIKLLKNSKNKQLRLLDLRESVDPNAQITALVQAVFFIFEASLKSTNPSGDLRIAYFRPIDGYLCVVHSWDRHGNSECVTSPNNPTLNREHYRLDGGDSLAVEVAVSGSVRIEPDTRVEVDKRKTAFSHFDQAQKEAIRSIVCIPIGPIKPQCQHVICLDTNIPNFFNDKMLPSIYFIRLNLERRLLYEVAMDSLLPKSRSGI